ncbi:MAG: hypothetical protein AVDCRST_MAG89-3207, partial [uncultured Gemmatimonadetes bacterium]
AHLPADPTRARRVRRVRARDAGRFGPRPVRRRAGLHRDRPGAPRRKGRCGRGYRSAPERGGRGQGARPRQRAPNERRRRDPGYAVPAHGGHRGPDRRRAGHCSRHVQHAGTGAPGRRRRGGPGAPGQDGSRGGAQQLRSGDHHRAGRGAHGEPVRGGVRPPVRRRAQGRRGAAPGAAHLRPGRSSRGIELPPV